MTKVKLTAQERSQRIKEGIKRSQIAKKRIKEMYQLNLKYNETAFWNERDEDPKWIVIKME